MYNPFVYRGWLEALLEHVLAEGGHVGAVDLCQILIAGIILEVYEADYITQVWLDGPGGFTVAGERLLEGF